MFKRIHCRSIVVVLVLAVASIVVACAPAPTPAPTAAPPTVAPATAAPQPTAAAPKPTEAPKPTAETKATSTPIKLQKVRVAYSAVTGFQTLLWFTEDKGIFDKYGLDIEFTQVAATQQLAAAQANQIDIGQTSCDNITSAIIQGADVKEFAMFVPYLEAFLYARPEIKTAQDLKGKLLGTSTSGPGIQRFATYYALGKLGLDREKDVEIRVFANTTQAFAALVGGSIQAVAVFPPSNLVAEKAGMNLLYDTRKDKVLYPTSCMFATNTYLKAHPDIIYAYVKALSEGRAVARIEIEPAVDSFLKWSKTDDRESARAGWEVFAEDMPDIPKWWPEAMQETLNVLAEVLPAAKTTDPTSLYDNSFIERLEKEGFYEELKKKYPASK